MNEIIDREKEEYKVANIRLAEAYHVMSEIYEKFATKGFESTRLSGLDLALGWECLSLENRRRHLDVPQNIKFGEENILRILGKMRELSENEIRDDKLRNT